MILCGVLQIYNPYNTEIQIENFSHFVSSTNEKQFKAVIRMVIVLLTISYIPRQKLHWFNYKSKNTGQLFVEIP